MMADYWDKYNLMKDIIQVSLRNKNIKRGI